MTEHEPLKIIVLCRSWREADVMIHNLAMGQQFTAVNFSRKRIVTKNKDDILFYTKDSKTIDGIHGDVLVTDFDITNLERQIVSYSRVGTDKNIWSYADLIDYLGADRMAAKCDMCGKIAKSYLTTGRGDIVCGKICYDAYLLELYLLRLEEDREANEQYNKKAYEQAKELSAILSVYKHGNKDARKEAGKLIERWFK